MRRSQIAGSTSALVVIPDPGVSDVEVGGGGRLVIEGGDWPVRNARLAASAHWPAWKVPGAFRYVRLECPLLLFPSREVALQGKQ